MNTLEHKLSGQALDYARKILNTEFAILEVDYKRQLEEKLIRLSSEKSFSLTCLNKTFLEVATDRLSKNLETKNILEYGLNDYDLVLRELEFVNYQTEEVFGMDGEWPSSTTYYFPSEKGKLFYTKFLDGEKNGK